MYFSSYEKGGNGASHVKTVNGRQVKAQPDPSRVLHILAVSYVLAAQHDELREIFNDISSSSEDEEDEGDRHEDEDLNIMDTEDDLVRQLQEKLNESDAAQLETDRNNQIGKRMSGSLCGWKCCEKISDINTDLSCLVMLLT